jgi:hypothetical protein
MEKRSSGNQRGAVPLRTPRARVAQLLPPILKGMANCVLAVMMIGREVPSPNASSGAASEESIPVPCR